MNCFENDDVPKPKFHLVVFELLNFKYKEKNHLLHNFQ